MALPWHVFLLAVLGAWASADGLQNAHANSAVGGVKPVETGSLVEKFNKASLCCTEFKQKAQDQQDKTRALESKVAKSRAAQKRCMERMSSNTTESGRQEKPKVPKVLRSPSDLKHCQSEGGTLQCALCDHEGGALPCGKPKIKDCPDTLVGGKFRISPSPTQGRCQVFGTMQNSQIFQSGSLFYSRWKKLGIKSISKGFAGHPTRAAGNIAYIAFKRVILHTHTTTNKTVADVHKAGLCIKCPMLDVSLKEWKTSSEWMKNPKGGTLLKKLGILSQNGKKRVVFANQILAQKEEIDVFVRHCLPYAFETVNAKGKDVTRLKDSYTCKDKEAPTNWRADIKGQSPSVKNKYGWFNSPLKVFENVLAVY